MEHVRGVKDAQPNELVRFRWMGYGKSHNGYEIYGENARDFLLDFQ